MTSRMNERGNAGRDAGHTRRSMLAAGAGVAAVAGGALVGCGEQGTAPRIKAPTSITVLFQKRSLHGDALTEQVERLAKQVPNLTVNLNTPADISWTVLQTMLAAGTPPDVSETDQTNAGAVGARKLAAPLQTLLKGAKDWSAADYFDGVREAFSYKGDQILAPYFIAPQAVAINLELVERANLKAPSSGWTWDQFVDYATKLTQRQGDETTVYGMNSVPRGGNFTVNTWSPQLYAYGGDWADRATGKLAFDRPEALAAFEQWVDATLKRRAGPLDDINDPAFKGLQGGPFNNGRLAMLFLASEALPNNVNARLPFRWTTVSMPKQKVIGSNFYGRGWMVLRDTKQPDGAGEFVRLTGTASELTHWNVRTWGMPTRKAATTKEWQEHLKAQPLLAPFDEATRFSKTAPPLPGWGEATLGPEGVGQRLADAITGKIAPRTTLQEAARYAQAIVDKNSG